MTNFQNLLNAMYYTIRERIQGPIKINAKSIVFEENGKKYKITVEEV